MIQYDDLVAALSAWRTRQGLPVNTIGGGGSGPHASPGSGPHQTGSGPHMTGSGPNKAPPPPPSASRPEMPVAAGEALEVSDELLDEAAYENEGNDFAMSFAGAPAGNDGESTQIGGAPERPTETDMGNDRDDW